MLLCAYLLAIDRYTLIMRVWEEMKRKKKIGLNYLEKKKKKKKKQKPNNEIITDDDLYNFRNTHKPNMLLSIISDPNNNTMNKCDDKVKKSTIQ